MDNNSKMIIYTTEDGLVKIETTFNDETVWLSLDQMSSLFQRINPLYLDILKIFLMKVN